MTRWTTAENLYDLGSGTILVTGPAANWLILREGSSCTLIDCGYPGDRTLVDASLRAAGVPGLPDAVVITHAHADHIGTLGRFVAAGVPVHCSAAEVPNMAGTAREQIGPKESLPRAARSWKWLTWSIHAIRVGGLKDVTVDPEALTPFTPDATALDVPGSPRPVATTGHTSGHTSYLIGGTGVLASGDAVITDHMVAEKHGVPQLLADPFHHDLPTASRTAVRLLSDTDFDVLAPGHGPPLRVPAGRRLSIH